MPKAAKTTSSRPKVKKGRAVASKVSDEFDVPAQDYALDELGYTVAVSVRSKGSVFDRLAENAPESYREDEDDDPAPLDFG